LVIAPRNLVDLHRDAGFLFVILSELLEPVGRRPLGPPDRHRARGFLVDYGGLRPFGAVVLLATDRRNEGKSGDEAEHRWFHDYLLEVRNGALQTPAGAARSAVGVGAR